VYLVYDLHNIYNTSLASGTVQLSASGTVQLSRYTAYVLVPMLCIETLSSRLCTAMKVGH